MFVEGAPEGQEAGTEQDSGGEDLQGASPVAVKKPIGREGHRARMQKYLKENAAEEVEEPEAGDEPADEPEEQDEATEAQDEPADEPADEDEDTDEKPEPESKDEKKKGRVARIRERYEGEIANLRSEVTKTAEKVNRAVYLANVWMQRAKQYEAQVRQVATRAQQANVPVQSPAEVEALLYKQQLAELKLQQEFQKQQQEQARLQAERQQIDRYKVQVTTEAQRLEGKFKVSAVEILSAYAAYRQIPGNENLGMEQVARALAALHLQKGRAAHQAQNGRNQPAPIPVRPGAAPAMKFKPNADGMADYLASIGMPIGKNQAPRKRQGRG